MGASGAGNPRWRNASIESLRAQNGFAQYRRRARPLDGERVCEWRDRGMVFQDFEARG
jgi:hypothetical protein